MAQNDSPGVGEDRGLEDLARVHGRAVERANAGDVDGDHAVFRVQKHDGERLTVAVSDYLPQDHSRVFWGTDETKPAGNGALADKRNTDGRDSVHGALHGWGAYLRRRTGKLSVGQTFYVRL